MVDIRIADPSIKDSWNTFVKNNNGSVFHLFEWSEVLQKSYGFKPIYFYASEGENILGIFPTVMTNNPFRRRLISLPFTDHAGFLSIPRFQVALLETYIDFCKANKLSTEIYSLEKIPKFDNLHIADTFILDTSTSFNELLSHNFSRSVRRKIQKSEDCGLTVKKEDASFLRTYYILYLETMKRLVKMPHSYSFLSTVFDYFSENIEIYGAYYKNFPVAGILTFVFAGNTYIWGNVSKTKYLEYAPNNALYSQVIKSACERKFSFVDFGSTPLGSGQHDFKLAWGGVAKPIYLSVETQVGQTFKQKGSFKESFIKFTPGIFLDSLSNFAFRYLY